MGSSTHLASPEPLLPSFSDQTPHHVYLALHTSTGISPLPQAVNTGVHRVSLVLLHTCDHVSWSSRLYCDALAKTHARPKSQAVLLMGLLRALWDHQASYDDIPLILHIPDSALVTSLRSPPTSSASEVTAWLNETVQLFLSPLVSLRHSPPVSVLLPNPQPSELGMHLAQAYAASGVSPLSPSPPFTETSFTVHPLGECFPVGALRDSWTWRDLLTRDPLLVPLEQRVQSLRRLQAQRTRDLDRASRGDPPICEDVTLHFAAKVLDLSYLPQGSRSHYEKLLHERHWSIGHNSCKEDSTASERRALLTCSLCSSPDRCEDDTYDHVFRLCPSPLPCTSVGCH